MFLHNTIYFLDMWVILLTVIDYNYDISTCLNCALLLSQVNKYYKHIFNTLSGNINRFCYNLMYFFVYISFQDCSLLLTLVKINCIPNTSASLSVPCLLYWSTAKIRFASKNIFDLWFIYPVHIRLCDVVCST